MTFRWFLAIMTLATAAAWVAWVVVLNAVDPAISGSFGFILFYTTLTIAIFGTISIFGVIGRLWVTPEEIVSKITLNSSRQSLLLSSLFIASLLLFSQGLFRWWTMLLVIIIASLIELTIISTNHPR